MIVGTRQTRRFLGLFADKIDAARAYGVAEAKKELNYHLNFSVP